MSNKIYIIGHQSPDLDSVAAAIAFSHYKNTLEKTDVYTPAVAGKINQETEYTLEKFGFPQPEILESAENKDIILVDHNEFSQAVNKIEKANIKEILDHHKLDFSYSEPIDVLIKAWGSSCSIIYHLAKGHGVELDKNMAGLMLSAVLVDTVITKSPTCTEIDKEIIAELAKLAEIDDWQIYGMEIFKVRSSVAELSAEEIIKADYKDFNFKAGKFGVGQVETADLSEIESRENELLEKMKEIKQANSYHSVLLFLTDIINEGSKALVVSDDEAGFEKAMNCKLEYSKVYLPGVLSRKKQVISFLSEEFDK